MHPFYSASSILRLIYVVMISVMCSFSLLSNFHCVDILRGSHHVLCTFELFLVL